ncbi:MAG: substrate-binding domain-containing protein [Bryobacteraceae bacterium]|jgi:ribose transport system substrate-binding protein
MPRFISFLTPVLLLPLVNCGGSQHDVQEKYFLISANTKVPYWQEAAAGFNHAAAQMRVHAEFVGPETYDPKAQHEQFQDVLKQKPTGILVSASAPDLLNQDIDAAVAQGVPVIAIDSDAPDSKRLFFIGTDNYRAGVTGARMLAKGLAGKGNVVVFTIPEQANLKDRLRGYTDVFAEHPQIHITQVIDEHGDPGAVFDRTMEMVEKGAKVDAFACLTSIAAPEVAEVLGRKNVTGKLVVAMDTDPRTLEGIQKGLITATIGQKPFTMAYLGAKLLDDLHHHPLESLTTNWPQDSFSPIPTFVDTGATLIDKSNVESFIRARNSATAAK